MSIERIKKIMPVPDRAVEAGGHDWASLSSELKKDFPKDYKEFVSLYGTGSIGEFLWIINPFSINPNLNLEKVFYFLYAYQSLRQDFPDLYPRKKESFWPWGFTDNGDCLFWLLDGGSPDKWQVGIQASDPSSEEMTNMTTSEFLEALVEKRFSSVIFPAEFLVEDKEFFSI
ncbi:SMI1/KNR4 family protein [Billgrantia sp. Q4P2]|uniref:SMI1/KNR4 family protein n=1 Tax=Billgrantia sp. Q4P2 TaxID=3463857 RepID=UPI004055ABC6